MFNPATPLDHAKYVLDKVDIILLMSVNPGFGGQSFIPSTLDKLREARKMIDESGYDIRLEVVLPKKSWPVSCLVYINTIYHTKWRFHCQERQRKKVSGCKKKPITQGFER